MHELRDVGRKPSAGAKTFVKLKPRIRQIRAFALPEGKAADRAQRARGRLPRSTAAGDDTLRIRIEPMEEEGAVGQRSRRSPSPRRSPPAVEGVLVGDEGGDIESRPTHVTGGMGDERERCALRRRLRRARGRRKPRSRSTPRCNGSLASIQLSRQQKWGWSGWGWMPIEGERLQLRPVAAAPCGSCALWQLVEGLGSCDPPE